MCNEYDTLGPNIEQFTDVEKLDELLEKYKWTFDDVVKGSVIELALINGNDKGLLWILGNFDVKFNRSCNEALWAGVVNGNLRSCELLISEVGITSKQILNHEQNVFENVFEHVHRTEDRRMEVVYACAHLVHYLGVENFQDWYDKNQDGGFIRKKSSTDVFRGVDLIVERKYIKAANSKLKKRKRK